MTFYPSMFKILKIRSSFQHPKALSVLFLFLKISHWLLLNWDLCGWKEGTGLPGSVRERETQGHCMECLSHFIWRQGLTKLPVLALNSFYAQTDLELEIPQHCKWLGLHMSHWTWFIHYFHFLYKISHKPQRAGGKQNMFFSFFGGTVLADENMRCLTVISETHKIREIKEKCCW